MEDCIFCKIINKEIEKEFIHEDNHTIAFFDRDPVNVGHMLVIPKKHFKTVDEMDKEEYDKLSESILKLSKGIINIADGMNIQQNNNEVAGQVVPHVHFHLIPRYKGDGYKFNWKRDESVTDKETEDFLGKMKTFLK